MIRPPGNTIRAITVAATKAAVTTPVPITAAEGIRAAAGIPVVAGTGTDSAERFHKQLAAAPLIDP